MRTSVKIYAIGGLILCIVIVGAFTGWFRGQDTTPEDVTPLEPAEPVTVVSRQPERYAPLRARDEPLSTTPAPLPTPSNAPAVEPVANAVAGSFQSIDDILGSSLDETQKVQQLFALFPKLTGEDQEEAVQHISNLLPDENYAPLGKLLTDAKLPEAVLDALMTDVLNRGDALKLPALLDVAKQPNHAMASDARDVLEIYLEHDYGVDWTAWDEAIKRWLKENEAEEP
jgi:hypothetical protein